MSHADPAPGVVVDRAADHPVEPPAEGDQHDRLPGDHDQAGRREAVPSHVEEDDRSDAAEHDRRHLASVRRGPSQPLRGLPEPEHERRSGADQAIDDPPGRQLEAQDQQPAQRRGRDRPPSGRDQPAAQEPLRHEEEHDRRGRDHDRPGHLASDGRRSSQAFLGPAARSEHPAREADRESGQGREGQHRRRQDGDIAGPRA